jgi:hypothetical protein
VAGKARAPRRAAGPQWTPEQVVELAVAHDLAELEIESMGLRIRVVRGHAPVTMAVPAPAAPASLSPSEAVAPVADTVPGAITVEAPMVGTFETKVRTWMDPDPTKPPEDTAGSSANTWALGDRYVQMKYEGIMMGETLNGVGFLGFDNVSKKYVSTWMDTAGTGMMWSTGTIDASGKVLSMKAMVNDPSTGKPSPADTKITITQRHPSRRSSLHIKITPGLHRNRNVR